MMKNNKKIISILTLITAQAFGNDAIWVGMNLQDAPCKGRTPNYGPFDYSKQTGPNTPGLAIVEIAHFTPEVENLIRGTNSGESPAGDLDYTLIAWPNHHRALLSVINFQLKINNKLTDYKLNNSPECYIQRAIHFSPQDPVPYSLFGYYLKKIGDLNKSAKFYEKAITLAPENPKIAYSYSLLLIDLKRYQEAVKYAQIAYKQKGTPEGLRNKLNELGAWHN
jgi:tetratricopeptide (TPR) repeat protein